MNDYGWECYGIRDGFLGLIENNIQPLAWDQCSNILTRGGTILGTSNKANPSRFAVGKDKDGEPIWKDVREQAMKHYREHDLDAVVVIGGDGTMPANRSPETGSIARPETPCSPEPGKAPVGEKFNRLVA